MTFALCPEVERELKAKEIHRNQERLARTAAMEIYTQNIEKELEEKRGLLFFHRALNVVFVTAIFVLVAKLCH